MNLIPKNNWQKRTALILSATSFFLLLGISLLTPQKNISTFKVDQHIAQVVAQPQINANQELITHLQELVEELKNQVDQGLTKQAVLTESLQKTDEEKQKLYDQLVLLNDKPEEKKEIITPKPQQKHLVTYGDTLSNISMKYYGTSKRWTDIYQANQSLIPNQNNLRTGIQLIIP